VNYSPLAGIHFTKNKGLPRGPYALCRKTGHLPQLCFASRAKPFDVADESLPIGKHSSECLIYEVLHRLQKFSALYLQQLCVGST
jgi:hypothetical protein